MGKLNTEGKCTGKVSILLIITLHAQNFWSQLNTTNCHSILMPEVLINFFHYLTWITHVFMWICLSVFIRLYVCGCVYITHAYILAYFPLTNSFSCCCCCCFFFRLFFYFCPDLRDHNENNAFLPVFCNPNHFS